MALSYFDEEVGGVEELWVTDGTSLGAHAVASFGSGAIQSLTTIGSRVFFAVNDGTHGQELWTSDGTAAGTMMVKDIFPGPTSSFPTFLTSASGDGFSDILFQNTNGQAAIWEMNGLNQIAGGSQLVGPNPGASWRAVSV